MNDNKKTGKYGLPLKVKYCVKCNVTNQRPTSINEYQHDKDTHQIPISFDKNNLYINDRKIRCYREDDPSLIPWEENDISLVIESTGKFNEKKQANKQYFFYH